MIITGNTPLAGKHSSPSAEEEKKLFDAGIVYLTNGVPEAAYDCFGRIATKDLCILFNKALCCYKAQWYEGCYQLLTEAEALLPTPLSQQDTLPPPLIRQKYISPLHFCPIPWGVPPGLAKVQLLRLKAEAAFRLRLYGEVKMIAARLQKPYRHIEELLKQISDEIK